MNPPPELAPGLLIAAPRSGSGKTVVTLGIARALTRAGRRVRAVKNGPDYIDAAFQAAATGLPNLNLDTFAMGDDLLAGLAAGAAASCDLIVAEGAMGLHDGSGSAPGRTGASADLAARLGWPVILVLDVTAQAATAAAVALGLARFDSRIDVAGVILNRVASERHRALVTAGFERIDIPVLGAIARGEEMELPARHLGLVQAREIAGLDERLDRIADIVEGGVDLARLVSLARSTRAQSPRAGSSVAVSPPGGRIALARDDAFAFMYEHVLAGWREQGATILPFSPLADEAPPEEADCCWLPGGYPELHAGRLAGAARFIEGLRAFAARRPVHGECGGYMVLGETLDDAQGRSHRMAGLLPLKTSFARRRLHLGYREARLLQPCSLGPAGTALVGHEFHYASIDPDGTRPADLAEVRTPDGRDIGPVGHRRGLVSGSFFHVIAAAGA